MRDVIKSSWKIFNFDPGRIINIIGHTCVCVCVHVAATNDGQLFLEGVAGVDAGGEEGLVWPTSPNLNKYADPVLSKAGATVASGRKRSAGS